MEVSAKQIFLLIGYFLVLTFIVIMFNSISDTFDLETTYTTSGGALNYSTLDGYAGSPRFPTLVKNGISEFNIERDKSAILLVNAGVIYDNTTCLEFSDYGFSWEVTNFLTSWLPWVDGQYGCVGYLEVDTLTLNSTEWEEGGSGFTTKDPICELPGLSLPENKQLALNLGCTWYEGQPQSTYSARGSEGANVIWESLKEIATLNVNFPIENGFLHFFVNFIIIGFPALLLLVMLIIFFRQIAGFT